MKSTALFFGLLVCAVAVASAQGYIGRLDTIGGTTYDWWTNGPILQMVKSAPGYGMHVTWMWSVTTTGTTFPDRNMRYNYYDYNTHSWSWIDPNYMQSGVSVFTVRAGYGNVDADPATGAAIIGCHYTATSGNVTPLVAKDVGPGVGLFHYADGYPVLDATQWPVISVGQNGTIHIFAMSAAYGLAYARILPGDWPDFDSVRHPTPSPGFPTHNIAASKVSGKVCLIWEMSTDDPQDGYMETSTDNGTTWPDSGRFLPPAAFGGDTVTSFHITSLYPWYDWEDRLHVVANVVPEVNDTTYIIPSQIWHYCADNTPQWSRIHIASCAPIHMQALVGYNSTYADRPTIGEGNDGQLYVAWEQFDSSNVEPQTNRLRAGIWVSSSADNGVTWMPGLMVTERNTFSHRFPSIVDRMVPGGPSEDTICIRYEMDSVAGFFVEGEGPVTNNPVICQFIPSPLVGAKETPNAEVRTPNCLPTIVRGMLRLPMSPALCPEVLLDIAGRRVLCLHPGPNDVSRLRPGVYFVSGQGAGDKGRKVIVTR